MTTVYVNGKRVTKEEIAKIEIRNEAVRRILAEKLVEKKWNWGAVKWKN